MSHKVWLKSPAVRAAIFALAVLVFILPDAGTMAGTDFSYYLDLAAYIQRGGRLFLDYSDYRLPVFSLLVSPLMALISNDVILRLGVMFCVYMFYGAAVYVAARKVTGLSRDVAWLAAFVAVITVTARNFDPGRNEVMPLFHETFVLVALALMLFVLQGAEEEGRARQFGLAVAAGAACAMGFLGRQVGVLPGLVMLALAFLWLSGVIKAKAQRRAVVILWAGFPLGFAVVAGALLAVFAWGNPTFFPSVVTWVFIYPVRVYGAPGLLPRLAAPFTNLFEFYALTPWVLWVAVVAVVARSVLRKNADVRGWTWQQWLLPLLVAVNYVLVPFLIGRSVGIYQLPAVTFFALLFGLAVDGVAWPQFWRAALVPALLVSPMWLTQAVVEAKGVHWGWKGVRNPQIIFTNRLAEAVKGAMARSGPNVLNLGGYSSVGRLTGYHPFMGLALDCLLYEAPRFLPRSQLDAINGNLGRLDVMYGFMDTPCLSHAAASPAMKAYFSRNFRVFAYVASDQSYPYNYSQPMAVYVRKDAVLTNHGGLPKVWDAKHDSMGARFDR